MKDLITAAKKYKTYKGYSRYFDNNVNKYVDQGILRTQGVLPARKDLFQRIGITSAENFYNQHKVVPI